MILDLITTAEAEFIARRYRRAPTIGAHAMLLVGFNDEYKMTYQSKGGFIVQNSWGTILGHSLKYLTGELSRRDEEYLCPNYYSPYEWVPINCAGEDKWKLRNTTVLQLMSTSGKWGWKPGHFHTETRDSYAEALTYVKSTKGIPLNDTVYYVVSSIQQHIDQTVSVTLGITTLGNPTQNFTAITEFVTLPPAPFDYLAFFLAPLNVDNTMNNDEDCGYYFIPYDFVNMVNQI